MDTKLVAGPQKARFPLPGRSRCCRHHAGRWSRAVVAGWTGIYFGKALAKRGRARAKAISVTLLGAGGDARLRHRQHHPVGEEGFRAGLHRVVGPNQAT